MASRIVLALAALALGAGSAQASSDEAVKAHLAAVLEDRDAPGPIPRVRRIDLSERRAVLGIEVPLGVDPSDLPPGIENRYEVAVGALAAVRPGIDRIDLLVAHPGEPLRPPKRAAPPPAPPPEAIRSVRPDPTRYPFGQALVGKTVAISPGHGYIYYDSLGRYSTQRGNLKWQGCGSCDGIVEDFGTHQLAVRYLVPLLEGAGARVVLVRERDYGPSEARVDDGDPGYAEVAGAFSNGSSPGGSAGDYRVSNATDAAVEYRLAAPFTGPQVLSLWFVSGFNRHPNARLEVEGPTGTQRYQVDMLSHGRRWAPVTTLYLEAGDPLILRLTAPEMPAPDRYLIADAARLGGGTHASGHAWWSMGAQPFAAFQEAPDTVQGFGDVSIRPRYAEMYGADAYLSLHSNASGQTNSTAAGTSSYRFNCGRFPDHSNDPSAAECDDPAGSDRLQALVHGRMVDRIEAEWDPNWRDRGPKVANFGELRNLDGIPGVLMESAFHDNVVLPAGSDLKMTDNQALHDPRWRRAAAYGLYEGLTEFLVPGAPVVPRPPEALAARRVSDTQVEVDFTPVPGAEGYRVYASTDGRRFDAGRVVDAPPARLDGLPAGAVVGVKVAALNAAGEGWPSRTVAARPSARPAQILIVDAFEREDAWVQEWDNRGDSALTHALALSGVEHAFDGVTEAGIEAGLAELEGYDALVIALGRESTEHDILTPALRDRVRAAAEAGAAVFFGGTEIGWVLDARGDAAGRAFLDDLFGAVYAADDAGSPSVVGAPGGWLADLPPTPLADAGRGLMETAFADAFSLGTDGVGELAYADGALAAVRRGRNLLLGIALENVVGADARAGILGGWLAEGVPLAPPETGPTPDGGIAPPDAGADAGSPEADAGDVVPGPDAGVPGVDAGALKPTAARPIRGGCGCRGAEPGAVAASLLVFGLVALLRRRHG